jgi:cytochrome b
MIRVWDPFVRSFHGALAASFVVAISAAWRSRACVITKTWLGPWSSARSATDSGDVA